MIKIILNFISSSIMSTYGFYMIKIEMENELGLEVFINGVPDLKEIPPDKLESLLAVLEMQISKYYEKHKWEYSNFYINFT